MTGTRRAMRRRANRHECATGVLSLCHGFKVRRVVAERRAAEVVESQPFGDWPDHQFVGDSVGRLCSPRTVLAHSEGSVAQDGGASPEPTLVWPASIDLGPKTLGEFRSGWKLGCPEATGAVVVESAETVRVVLAYAPLDRAGNARRAIVAPEPTLVAGAALVADDGGLAALGAVTKHLWSASRWRRVFGGAPAAQAHQVGYAEALPVNEQVATGDGANGLRLRVHDRNIHHHGGDTKWL